MKKFKILFFLLYVSLITSDVFCSENNQLIINELTKTSNCRWITLNFAKYPSCKKNGTVNTLMNLYINKITQQQFVKSSQLYDEVVATFYFNRNEFTIYSIEDEVVIPDNTYVPLELLVNKIKIYKT